MTHEEKYIALNVEYLKLHAILGEVTNELQNILKSLEFTIEQEESLLAPLYAAARKIEEVDRNVRKIQQSKNTVIQPKVFNRN